MRYAVYTREGLDYGTPYGCTVSEQKPTRLQSGLRVWEI